MSEQYVEADCLPLSALQHLLFCERQCALIHLEGVWADTAFTVEGSHLHKKADDRGYESRGEVRSARGLPLRSLRLGLIGKADVVEFHRCGSDNPSAVPVPGIDGRWAPFPVEFKRGRPKRNRCDEVQVCAQALCLEEMLGVSIPEGALFYGQTKRRLGVVFDPDLRGETEKTVARLHGLIAAGVTPRAVRESKCDNCSLLNHCLPGSIAPGRSAARYLAEAFAGVESDSETSS